MKTDATVEKNGLSIIVIEDNLGDYVLIEDFLMEKFKAITIKQYYSYESVCENLKEKEFKCDLILLDLHLPDKSGLALLQNMISQFSHIPIIILTGYADLPLAKKSLELGFYDFLIKDEINPGLLHKSIEFAISRSSYVRQIEFQNEQLKSIAWTQSHIVRAPLARILGIVDIIDSVVGNPEEFAFWLDKLKVSSNEMDEIVRSIVKETQSFKLNK